MKLVSACLLGIKCRYDSKDKLNEKVLELAKKEYLIPICPEQLGGLPTPREPNEFKGNGCDVLERKSEVYTVSKKNVTQNFIKGANEVLKLAKLYEIKEVILKQKSHPPAVVVKYMMELSLVKL
jgi:uncharacterized protein YbbK (DUF523 family)